jgi:hypothetical protein
VVAGLSPEGVRPRRGASAEATTGGQEDHVVSKMDTGSHKFFCATV